MGTDKIVLITGAAGHLGKAVAFAFMHTGAAVVLVDRDAKLLQRTFGLETPTRIHLAVDLLDSVSLKTAIDSVLENFGRIDVLCNLAGGFSMGEAVHETASSTWDLMFALNVRTLQNTSAAVVPHMLTQKSGKVINVGAFAAQRGVAQMGAYVASKSAVIRLTESMSAELRESNINVNCVLPTIIDTPDNRTAMPESDPARWVAPADLANVIVFLASDAARAVHGSAVPVTGLS